MTLIFGCETLVNRAQSVVEPARRYEPSLSQAILVHHHYELFRLVRSDSLVGNEQGRVWAASLELHTHEQARREQTVGIVNEGACPQGAGLRVEAVVHEIHLAFVRKILLVRERNSHGIRELRGKIFAARKGRAVCT